jgi:hypothetical protein
LLTSEIKSDINNGMEKEITLRSICSDAANFSPDNEKSLRWALDFINADDDLRESLVEQAFKDAILAGLHSCRYSVRNGSFPKINPCARDLGIVEQSSEAHQRFAINYLIEQYTIQSKRLLDCTASELNAEAVEQEAMGRGCMARARIYRQLADRCGTKKLRQTLDRKEIEKFYKELVEAGHEDRESHCDFATSTTKRRSRPKRALKSRDSMAASA